MKRYSIENLFSSKKLIKRESNNSFLDQQRMVSVGGSDYADDIIALRKQAREAKDKDEQELAKMAIEEFCDTHFIDSFVTDSGQEILFVAEGSTC